MSILGDFIGFSYKEKHSSDLGILRVSDGSRFNENLLPPIQDKIVTIPGRDGAYYFGSTYGPRQIEINFAFDSLTESKLHSLKQLLNDKLPGPLFFDEAPYRVYQAKITGSTLISYIPFVEKGVRVYKGEGKIQFSCYQPYAICPWDKKSLNNYKNSEEWNVAAGLINLNSKFDKIQNFSFKEKGENDVLLTTSLKGCLIHNPGDKESDWNIQFPFNEDGTLGIVEFYYQKILFLEDQGQSTIILTTPNSNKMIFKGCTAKHTTINGTKKYDEYISFNTETRLVEGWYHPQNGGLIKSGNIYNEFLAPESDFFKIPQGCYIKDVNFASSNFFVVNTTDTAYFNGLPKLKYDYYYL